MSINRRIVVCDEADIVPVDLFVMNQGTGSYMEALFWALALFSPLDIVAIDRNNVSTLRREVARIIPVAVQVRRCAHDGRNL